jgi:hypothetical protein
MALLFAGMPCALCGDPVRGDQAVFSTWGTWLPVEHRLFKYCDAGMHWTCYAGWPDRPSFARSYFEFWIAGEVQNPVWHLAYLDDRVFVDVNPEPLSDAAWVVLAETGSRIPVKLRDWGKWLGRRGDGRHEIEELALAAAKEVLARSLTNRDGVIAAIDLDRKRELYERLHKERQEARRRNREKQAADRAHKERCRNLVHRAQTEGMTCTHCGVFGKQFRLAERSGRRSTVICRACGWPVEIS